MRERERENVASNDIRTRRKNFVSLPLSFRGEERLFNFSLSLFIPYSSVEKLAAVTAAAAAARQRPKSGKRPERNDQASMARSRAAKRRGKEGE